jgi:hypothetical protein
LRLTAAADNTGHTRFRSYRGIVGDQSFFDKEEIRGHIRGYKSLPNTVILYNGSFGPCRAGKNLHNGAFFGGTEQVGQGPAGTLPAELIISGEGGAGQTESLQQARLWPVFPGIAMANGVIRDLHAGAAALHTGRNGMEAVSLDPIVLLPADLLHRMVPGKSELIRREGDKDQSRRSQAEAGHDDAVPGITLR